MSTSALLKGVEARLRDVLADPEGRSVGVQPAARRGRPPASMGQLYYAVWWGGGRGADRDPQSSDVLHALTVTLTVRVGFAPRDRRGKAVADAFGFYELADQLAAGGVIHGSQEVLALANVLIPGTAGQVAAAGTGTPTVNGFVEPLVLLDYGPEREEGPEWVGARDGAGDVYAIDVRFGEARRLQRLF